MRWEVGIEVILVRGEVVPETAGTTYAVAIGNGTLGKTRLLDGGS